METKKVYLYSGLAIVSALAIYLILSKQNDLKKDNTKPDTKNASENDDAIVTNTGDIVSKEQIIINPELQVLLDLPLSNSKIKFLKKKLYTKLDNVNPRTSNYVNNGVMNNTYGGVIKDKDTLIGTVLDVVEDKGGLKNSNGKVYKWFKMNPSKEAIDSINNTKSWFNPPVTSSTNFYVREDVIHI